MHPEHLWPEEDLVKTCRTIAEETGARLTLTADVDEGVRGVDYLYTDVWVSSRMTASAAAVAGSSTNAVNAR